VQVRRRSYGRREAGRGDGTVPTAPWRLPRAEGKDGALDLIAQSDPLDTRGPRIKGQVKRRRDSTTTEEEFRSFLSLVESADVGLYISLGGLTADAEASARRSSRRIILIDGGGLVDSWVEHYDKFDEGGRRLLPIKPVHFLDLEAATA
jgi:restriction system protein